MYPIYESFIKHVFCKYFLPVRGLSFNFLNGTFQRVCSFVLYKIQFMNFFLLWFLLTVSQQRNLCLIQDHKDYLLCLLLEDLQLMSMIHFNFYLWRISHLLLFTLFPSLSKPTFLGQNSGSLDQVFFPKPIYMARARENL